MGSIPGNPRDDDTASADEPSIEEMKQQTLEMLRQHRATQRAAGGTGESNDSNGAGMAPAPAAEAPWSPPPGMPWPPVGSVSEAALLPPNPPSGFNRDGTYSLRGDRATIRAQLDKAGITMFLPIQGGLMIGTSQAQRTHEMVMANLERNRAEDGNGRGRDSAENAMRTPEGRVTAFAPDFHADGSKPVYDFGDPLAGGGQPGAFLVSSRNITRPREESPAELDDGSHAAAEARRFSNYPAPPGKENEIPVLSKEAQRRQSIIDGTPGHIAVMENPQATAKRPLSEIGMAEQVTKYAKTIDEKSKELGVDPDLVKAIMYMETTHGYYDGIAALVDMNKSILPMNVRSSTWSGMGYSREDLKKPEANIEAGIKIIKGISDRLEFPSVRGVATLYNSLAKDKVSDYGARVEAIYKSKP